MANKIRIWKQNSLCLLNVKFALAVAEREHINNPWGKNVHHLLNKDTLWTAAYFKQ